ncbi:MAG: ABC transporter permease subunit [Lachnospiraceae bacterium]|nr:ABC transporter permease subunit [Lachnospiraceae bacterium]
MTAYIKKECMELTRTGRLFILGIIFIIFGILNPAMAKLTPWLYEMLQDSLSEQGLQVGKVTVNALTSWTQYYKNALMIIIAFILMNSTGFTGEYQKGSLVLVVTKGLSRRKIFLAKLLVGYGTWTLLFLLYTGITLGYTKYFWGEDEVPNLFFGILFLWLLGMLVMSLLVMFGTMSGNSGQVLLGTGGILFISILLRQIPSISKYMPVKLADGLELSTGAALTSDFSGAVIISSIMIIICVIIGVIVFDKRKL